MILRNADIQFLRWAIVSLVLLLRPSFGWSGCNGCRPRAVGNAPGVGIDLTMAYGTAAIHFKNGNIRNLGKIDGTPEYLEAMKVLAEDAQNVRRGLNSSLETVPDQPLVAGKNDYYFPNNWWTPVPYCELIISAWNTLITYITYIIYSPPPAYVPDQWTRAIATMLSDIKSTTMDTLDPPLKYHRIYLSWPDFDAQLGRAYSGRFAVACNLAGLELLGWTLHSRTALYYDGVEEWLGNSNEPPEDFYYPLAPLVISYNTASLGVTLHTRDDGSLYPARLVEDPQHGAERALLLRENNDVEKHWGEVKGLLETVIGDDPIDHILLVGSHARDPDLLQALKGVIEGHDNINPSILDRYLGPISIQLEEDDELLFAAARRAAARARFFMEEGYYACILPDYCEEDEQEEPINDSRSEL